MKTHKSLFVLSVLSVLLFWTRPASAADARVITENGTNILAIGIDNRDFEVVRIYFKGTNQFEIRADQILAKDRRILPPFTPALELERQALLNSLTTRTNFVVADAQTVVSNLIRLRLLEDKIANPNGR